MIKNSKEALYKLPVLNKIFKQIANRRRFKVEIDLLKGKHRNLNNRKSILHFSLNKAATQYVKSILQKASLENGLVYAGFNEYAFDSDIPYFDHLSIEQMEKYQHVFKPTGYLYSVFGGMVENIARMEDYAIVYAVRDPRDILVSNYYSIAFSHIEPNLISSKRKGFLQKRKDAKSISIDNFAINQAEHLLAVMNKYDHLLIKRHKNIYLAKYEDMINNFEKWLTDLSDKTGLNISLRLKNELIIQNKSLAPKQEDQKKHLRKGKSGDYLDKLQPQTIEFLNKKFGQVLQSLGYSQEPVSSALKLHP